MVAVAGLLAVLAGCGGSDDDGAGGGGGGGGGGDTLAAENLFDTDFEKVCDGVGQPLATAYSPTPGVIHPTVVLVAEDGYMTSRSSAVRAGWERVWAPEATMAMTELELVACAERTASESVQDCTGYQVDGVDTDSVVHLHRTTYDITLRAATTGAEVATTTITALDDGCPMFVSFSEGENEKDWYSFDDAAVQDFLAPYAAPGA